ncbi:Ubiquitin domain-containing protein 2 [Coemansia sp. RSA 2705]|nr:Ubiquitin domain-containing protein 2 [Coemansia sp. RSA 2705]
MGCCQSRAAASTQRHTAIQPTPEPTQRRRTIPSSIATAQIDFGHLERWNSEEPLTRSQLERKREEFWDTAPAYEGRAEVWQAVRLACESDDVELALAVLQSAGAVVPSRRVVDGVYDERGACYMVPQYCLSAPSNLIEDSVPKIVDARVSTDSGLRTAVVGSPSIPGHSIDSDSASVVSGSPLYPPGILYSSHGDLTTKLLRVRLSTGDDVEVRITSETSVGQIEQQLRGMGHLVGQRVRFIHLGRLLQPTLVPARDLRLRKTSVLQAMMY